MLTQPSDFLALILRLPTPLPPPPFLPPSLPLPVCRDGGYETSPFIGRFCGNQRPQVLVSHSNRLWLKFRSDLANTRRGFTAHWDGTQTGCGGNLLTPSGGFSSPSYPLPYHPNAECYWHIKSSRGSVLRLSFSDFHLEATGGCTYDY
ncbi:hypothetical protein CRUP_038360, partial [Coryphaenoides rupestris]